MNLSNSKLWAIIHVKLIEIENKILTWHTAHVCDSSKIRNMKYMNDVIIVPKKFECAIRAPWLLSLCYFLNLFSITLVAFWCDCCVSYTYTIFISILLFCCVTIDTIKIVKQTYYSNKKKSNNVLIHRPIHAFACIHLKAFILDILVTITINRKSIQ